MTERVRFGRRAAWLAAGLGLCVAASPTGAPDDVAAADAQPEALRVCADPANLPFSNDAEQGFENAIASVLAKTMGARLEYVWWPNTMGFIRNTLRAGTCDLVMGVVVGYELAATTEPYYRTSYAMVYRSDSGLDAKELGDPALHGLRFGVIANTPPADLLVKHGLIGNARPYRLMVDTRRESPAKQMIDDLADGVIDVALAWGPFAGYFAQRHQPPLTVVPLSSVPGAPPMEFAIAAAVRFAEPEWRDRVTAMLKQNRGEIDAILRDFGVPLLDLESASDRR